MAIDPTLQETLDLYRQAGKQRLQEFTAPLLSKPVLPVEGAYISQGVREGHVGIDFAVGLGTPVVAPTSGVVTSVQDLTSGYGRHVRVTTPEGEELIFGHLGDILVRLGQKITAGMQLGTVGLTGSTTGAHLHFERRVAGEAVDPWDLLRGAVEPNTDAMRYGVSSGQQSQTAKLPSTAMKVNGKTTAIPYAPASTYGVRSGLPPYSVTTTGEVKPEDKESLPEQVVTALSRPFERVAVGSIGVILIVVSLFMLSSGLREQTIRLGKEATKIIAGTATGGVGGAVAGAVA